MEYRPLGQTGLRVSVLGFGASSLGGSFGPIDEAEGIRAVRAAIDSGINFFDVSPFYGLTRAETLLGEALSTVPREKFHLATKAGRYGEREFDFSAERVTRSVHESLKRLRLDYIDVIQCHDVEFGPLDQIVNETIPALRKLQDQHKVKFVGITGLPLKVFRYVLDRSPVDTVLSYCHYALNDTTLQDLIPYLREKRAGVINAAPLSMGLLAERGLPPWHPAPVEIRQTCVRAAAPCRERGVELPELALRYSLANPQIDSTFVGIGTRADLARNLAAVGSPPDAELLKEVQALLAPIHNQTWPSGLPENN